MPNMSSPSSAMTKLTADMLRTLADYVEKGKWYKLDTHDEVTILARSLSSSGPIERQFSLSFLYRPGKDVEASDG